MRKIIILLLLFLVCLPAHAQDPVYKVYLPVTFNSNRIEHEIWKVVRPVGVSNYVLNPSGELSGNFSTLGAATVSRSTTYQLFGLYSYSVITGKNADGISFTLSALTNSVHTVSFRIRGRLPNNLRCILGASIKRPLFVESIDPDWDLYACTFSKESSNGQTSMRIIQQGGGIGNFYLDGIQVEPLSYHTTFIDGDQPGCYWNGTDHASISTRSDKSYDGGQVIDLSEEFGFFVMRNVGTGMPPRQNNVDSYAILPGGELNSVKIQVRDFSLVGKFIAGSEAELYANREALFTLLRGRGTQRLKWLIYHPNEIREIKASYNGGLEGDAPVYYDEQWSAEENDRWVQNLEFVESAFISLKATDPYFYSVGDKVSVLDTNDSATFRMVASRLRSTGQWDALGPPGAGGTYSNVQALAEDETYIYFGGNFTNFDGIANADYIVRWHKQDRVYSAMSTGMNNAVLDIVVGPTGIVYATGLFTTAGGGAAARIAQWNGTSWSALGPGLNLNGNSMVFGPNGLLYVAGDFTTAGGGSADYIASWNPATSSWAALGSGVTGGLANIVILGPDGNIYVGGTFTTAGGSTAAKVAYWNPTTSAWAALGSGIGGSSVQSLAFAPSTLLYIGGDFTSTGDGTSANYITVWNGAGYAALGAGMNNVVYSLVVGPDEIVYAGGIFSTAGGVGLSDHLARWNGSSWSHMDIDFPGNPTVYVIHPGNTFDPVIPQKYDLYLVFDTTGTGYFAGKITATNNGSADAFPKIIYERSGGTVVTIESLRNESTGKELLFNYNLLDGERLTIDLAPTKKSVFSNYFGNVSNAVLANSDFGLWRLEPGNNDITSFVANPNIVLYPSETTAWLQWKETFESFD